MSNSVLEIDTESCNVESQKIDIEQLERVKCILRNIEGDSDGNNKRLESRLYDIKLNLNEEFVMKVLSCREIPVDNLFVFYKWIVGDNNKQRMVSVTTKSLDYLMYEVRFLLMNKADYRLWDLVKEIGEKKNGVVTTEILNSMIMRFWRKTGGYEVFSKFGDFSCETNAETYLLTIVCLTKRGIREHIGVVCERMISEGKLPQKHVGVLVYSICKAGMVKEAYSVYLYAMEKQRYLRWKYVTYLFGALCDRRNIDIDSVRLAKNMLDDYYVGDQQKYAIKQFSCVIHALCRLNDIEGAKSLLTKMIDNGPPPGNAVFNTIINALCKSGDIAEAIKIMRIMEDRGLKPDVFTYSVIMSGYIKRREMENATKMFSEAKKNHEKLTPVIYHTMIRGYCKLERFGKAVKLLEEMEAYGVRASTDEYNKLIQSLCLKDADWGMAEKLIKEMTIKGLHLNGITKSLVRAVKELEQEAKGTKQVSVEA